MSDVEVLALIRMLLALVALPFACRAGYWVLAAALAIAAGVQLAAILDVSRPVLGAFAIAIYALLAYHALDISRRRHAPGRPGLRP